MKVNPYVIEYPKETYKPQRGSLKRRSLPVEQAGRKIETIRSKDDLNLLISEYAIKTLAVVFSALNYFGKSEIVEYNIIIKKDFI